ncbi:hypothetical protein BOTBODRAFT_384349 [Botryobasidium botryosum FD-172 SS1]|uniref:Uncharacterized protein n=1 Tax=Botryobasidium botryosum (strain FD-172 SS1) TaxID=930990 RepID=A0A067N8B0_BOTB1|nr:hypothetical protein BOTBODRAFT_384349 [Botryobasidium botryosum FD-172 SS1]
MHTKTIRLVYFLLGVSVGLPWYALFTASPYLLTRLDGWRLQPAFMSYLMLVSCISEASVLALASWTTTKVRVLVDHGIMRAISQFNASHRIRASISVFAITFPILAVSPSFTLSPSLFASLVTTIAILQSAGRAYLSVAIVTHASTYGPLAIHACISGQSTSGCLISTTQYIIALATAVGQRHSDSPDRRRPAEKGAIEASAIMFFGVATAFMVGILALHANVVSKMDVDWEYPRVASSENESLLSWEGSINETRATKCTTADKLNVAKINMAYNLAVGYVCMTSMAVWPAITISIASVNWGPSSSLFFSPSLFISFHFFLTTISKWIGTILASFPRFTVWSSRKILYISLARTIFIPLLLLCNIQRPGQTTSHQL